MPHILAKPGSVQRKTLPSQKDFPESAKMVFNCFVLDEGGQRELEAWHAEAREKGGMGTFETARRVIGRFVQSVENIAKEGGEPFELERDPSGFLTPECCAWFGVYQSEIVDLALGAGRVSLEEVKNSSSLSA